MSLRLHHTPLSPPCRATLLTIKALGIDVELVPVNLHIHEHLSADFLKINPMHTVPTLEDGDFSIWDSHAVNAYLVEKYGDDDALYPKDLQERAVVDQRLHFDSNVLSARLTAVSASILRDGARTIAKDKSDAIIQGANLLETVLENSNYVAGNKLTIADFSIVATITSTNVIIPLATNRFPKIFEWLERLQDLPYYKDSNQEGLDAFAALMKSKTITRQSSIR